MCRETGHDTAMPARTHAHDTASGARQGLRYGRLRAATRPLGSQDTAQGRGAQERVHTPRHGAEAPTIRPTPSHDTTRTRLRYYRPRAAMRVPGRASWASWVLVHPAWFFDLVFDLVMFLSHRLDPIHEHCSSQIFRKKKFI